MGRNTFYLPALTPARRAATDNIFGGQIGYNYQIDQYVIGIEGDFAGSNVKGDNQCSVALGTTCETKQDYQDYLASVRGRLGYAVDRLLIYGDAGVAFTKYKIAEVDGVTPQTFGGGPGLVDGRPRRRIRLHRPLDRGRRVELLRLWNQDWL